MSPLAWIALVLAQAPLYSQGHGPVRTGKPASELSARECQTCHERVYAEWSRTRHALAWSNPLFTESFHVDGGIYARSLTGNAEGHLNPLHDRDICPQ